MPIITKLFSMEEAAQHNTKDDCWVIIDGKVYDVTLYLDEHPGGDDVLLTATGMFTLSITRLKAEMPGTGPGSRINYCMRFIEAKDAKEEFEDAGHSQDARDLMEKFFIGELDPSASTIPESKVFSKKQEQADTIPNIKDLSLLYWAAPVAIACISVVVGFLYLRKK
ncbi:hypothetical protein Cgig2_009422 [Carnegiea gigantea]|uniref:Cytochrome b5 heme-binding domain-containing protein n=1 Tax=Carnegiea gigantea TaxID=171969 RepID=A0A9Q1Q6C7_9CARY|nr:hypothetical protein Cgig2_009422 [Carnegiea gigantea]